jgi:PAS domain S-box-containing protein
VQEASAAPVGAYAELVLSEAKGWLHQPGSPATTAAPDDRGKRSRRVLIVDDNADMRAYLASLLSVEYEVHTAVDGSGALESATVSPPDLVVADVMMPHMDGFELLARLRSGRHTRAIPVLMLSARAGSDAAVLALTAGADDYLVKPFDASELQARVRSAVGKAAAREEQRRGQEEESYRFFELSVEVMGMTGFDGYLKRVNPAYAKALGYTEAELLSQPYLQLIHPDDRQRVTEAVGTLAAGDTVHDLEVRLMPRTGVPKVFLMSANASTEQDVFYFAGSEITARREAEAALRDSEQRFRTVATAVPVGVFQAGPAGEVVFANEWFSQIYARPAAQLSGDAWIQHIHPEDRARVRS